MSDDTVYKCDQCNINCESEKDLRIHIGKVHKIQKSPEKQRCDFLSTSLQVTAAKEERQESCHNCDTPMSPGHQCENSDDEEPNESITETNTEETESSEIRCVKECPRYHKPSKQWCDGIKCYCDESCVIHCDSSLTCYCEDCAPFTSKTPTKKTQKQPRARTFIKLFKHQVQASQVDSLWLWLA